MFEFIFDLILNVVGISLWGISSVSRIEARLVPSELQKRQEFYIEIENISNKTLDVGPIIKLYLDDGTFESRSLNIEEDELILPPFSPTKVSFQFPSNKEIKILEFQVMVYGKTKVKLTNNYSGKNYA